MVNIPERFADGGFLEDIYLIGYSHGYGVTCRDFPRVGQVCWTEAKGRVVATPENIRSLREAWVFEGLRHRRLYSPFESIAKELNDFGEGGFFIIARGKNPIGPFASVPEAEKEAGALGLEDYEIEDRPSSAEAWEAFEAGERAAIQDDLKRYDDASEDEDSEDGFEA